MDQVEAMKHSRILSSRTVMALHVSLSISCLVAWFPTASWVSFVPVVSDDWTAFVFQWTLNSKPSRHHLDRHGGDSHVGDLPSCCRNFSIYLHINRQYEHSSHCPRVRFICSDLRHFLNDLVDTLFSFLYKKAVASISIYSHPYLFIKTSQAPKFSEFVTTRLTDHKLIQWRDYL